MINIAMNKPKDKTPKRDKYIYDLDEVNKRIYNNISLTEKELPRQKR